MKIYRIPVYVDTILFDIDSTLYFNPEYAAFQNRVLIEEFAHFSGISYQDAIAKIEQVKLNLKKTNRAGNTSLGNIFFEMGIPIKTSVFWRKKLIHPENWLYMDDRLHSILRQLSISFRLVAVTNNPKIVGRKTLEVIGIEKFFSLIVGLDDTMKSKPSSEPFEFVFASLKIAPENCLAIGDRFDVDLATPLNMGCGGLLINGPGDLIFLPSMLGAYRAIY